MSTLPLPPVPAEVLDAAGAVACGKYTGAIPEINWSLLGAPYRRGRWWRHTHHKRWQYLALATDDLFCGAAIVDVGWTNTAFAYIFDRQQKRLLGHFSQDGVPGLTARINDYPSSGAASHFRFLGKHIHFAISHDAEATLDVDGHDFSLHATLCLHDAAPSLTAIGPVEGGAVHATVKSSAIPLQGSVEVAGRRWLLDGGVGSSDYSNGFLARDTAWRWASAHSRAIGFNLQAGYFGNNENALWLDGEIIGLGAASFDFDPTDPMGRWHITTDDGLLDVYFQPEGYRQENKNLLIAASRYIQPIGTFRGWVRAHRDAPLRVITDLVGVTEDHTARW